MAASVSDPIVLARAGIDALRRGDARTARDNLAAAAASGRVDASVWLGLSMAHARLGEAGESLAAIDRALGLEPRNLRALLMKADHFAAVGDGRAAAAFYQAVVRHAAADPAVPPDLAPEIRRAEAQCASYAAAFGDILTSALRDHGFEPGVSSPRFGQSLDLLLGKKRVYLQEPRYYYFPELPQIQFYERAACPWLDPVEAAMDDIRGELTALLDSSAAFQPYLRSLSDRPFNTQHEMLDNTDWSAFFLWRNGEEIPENAARCPKTLAALADSPLARIKGRTPSILFSALRPGARIPPHNGFINTRLICHLPLIVPDGCGFRVGNETRTWREGQAFAFDDTIQHEAWNSSDKLRVVLIFDVWRPELSEEERGLVTAMFEAIDAQGGPRQAWNV